MSAWAALLLLGLIWGASFLSIRIALNEIGPLSVVVHRTGWAAVLLWLVVFVRRSPVPRSAGVWGALVVMGLLNNVIPFALMAWAQLYVETGLTAILNATTSVFAVLLAALFFADERLDLQKFIAVLIGFAGVVLAMGPDALLSLDPSSLAQFAVLLGAFSYACAGVWARRNLKGLRPEVAAAGMVTSGFLTILPVAWAVEGPISLSLSVTTWSAIAYYSVIATGLAYLLYYRILAEAGAGNLLIVTLIVPPVSVALGALVLSEKLGPGALLGFGLLALCLLLLNRPLTRKVAER